MAGARITSGLSPRVRGNRERDQDPRRRAGTIPACAGEPEAWCRSAGRRRDYPRVCGGTYRSESMVCFAAGLSPRVRGNPFNLTLYVYRYRTIPACAGEPAHADQALHVRKDYPRVCGGTCCSTAARAAAAGLSPRVRGNHTEALTADFRPGTIPACAGEPGAGSLGVGLAGDYPRVCGGTPRIRCGGNGGTGLSPRVRGNRRDRQAIEPREGTIPACAGEPL